jgi:DNA-binding NtrC family response regulator
VLVVDDEANARSALEEFLSDEGYIVATAPDGQTAIALLGTFQPDVVLTDLHMPGVDGVGLLDHGARHLPELPFVVMTAFGSPETEARIERKGAAAYLTKPLDLERVADAVRDVAQYRRHGLRHARMHGKKPAGFNPA